MRYKLLVLFVLGILIISPGRAKADIVDIVGLSSPSATLTQSGPLNCYDLKRTLLKGSTGYDVRGLQFSLLKEGMNIPASEYGMFGDATEAAVMSFQQKYAAEILSGIAPTGIVGQMTRAKLNSLYGCDVVVNTGVQTSDQTSTIPSKVSLQIKDTELDSTGVTAVFCNNSSGDLPVFPVRLRLNGVVRDFNIRSVLKMGTCSTESLPYSAWGLTYDPNTTYALVSAIDPNNMYKTSSVTYPISLTNNLSIPAVSGYHLSVRGVQIKSNGIQATVCNLGDQDVTSYPVRVTVNGVKKDLDAPGANMHGKCTNVTWTYDTWNITPSPGFLINATINVDPNNVYKESNEFDNAAAIVGTI